MTQGQKTVDIFVIGTCDTPNNFGSYGVLLSYNNHYKELSGKIRITTQKRVHLIASIVALRALKYNCNVNLHIGDEYIVTNMKNGKIKKLAAREWKNNENKKLAHRELWMQLLSLHEMHTINYVLLSEMAFPTQYRHCKELANNASLSGLLHRDLAYETSDFYLNAIRNKPKRDAVNKKNNIDPLEHQRYNSWEETQWVYDPKEEAWYIFEDDNE